MPVVRETSEDNSSDTEKGRRGPGLSGRRRNGEAVIDRRWGRRRFFRAWRPTEEAQGKAAESKDNAKILMMILLRHH